MLVTGGVRAETLASTLHKSASASELARRRAPSGPESARRRLVGAAALRDIQGLAKALSPRTA